MTRVDKLGERLKLGRASRDDLIALEQYRRSFRTPYSGVVADLRDVLRLAPTGRPSKSTQSIVEKLKRESVRLSQMQDIAGCRVVVDDIKMQDEVVKAIRDRPGTYAIFDRRLKPSSGYRAVHIVIREDGRPVEVQVRTELQHRWAEFSEKLADFIDPTLKYGGGPDEWRKNLNQASSLIADVEKSEVSLRDLEAAEAVAPATAEGEFTSVELWRKHENLRTRLREYLEKITSDF